MPIPLLLHFPITGADLLHMIIDMLKISGSEDIYAKLASNPRLIAGSELAFGRRITPEEYKQLLTTPDSPLQKAANIERLYFQILVEIIQINSDVMANERERLEQASRAQIYADEEAKAADLKQQAQNIQNNEDDKKAEVKRIQDYKDNNYVIPPPTPLEALNAEKNKLQAVEDRITTLSSNVVTVLNKRNEKMSEILKERNTVLIESVNREIAGYDDVLGNLRRNLASAQSPEEIVKINRQIEGVESIKELYVEYAEEEKTIANRTTEFVQNPEVKLKSAVFKEGDLPSREVMAGLSGVLLDFHLTKGKEKRDELLHVNLNKKTTEDIVDLLGKKPTTINLPNVDRAKLAALMNESKVEVNGLKEELRNSKNEHKKIQENIKIKEDNLSNPDKQHDKFPQPISSDEPPKTSSPDMPNSQSVDKNSKLNGTHLPHKIRAESIIKSKNQDTPESPKPDKPEPPDTSPSPSGFSRH